MKKIKKILLCFILIMMFIPNIVSAKDNEVTLYLFYSKTCPHCHNEREYLKKIKNDYPNLKIKEYEVTTSEKNSNLMVLVGESLGEDAKYIPYTIIGTNSLVGFNEYTQDKIEEYIEECSNYECFDVVSKVKKNNESIEEEVQQAKIDLEEQKKEKPVVEEKNDSEMTIPILGKIDAKDVSLQLTAIVIGFVDGFNPCAMWVLIFLISMLLGMKDRKRMWIIGLSFLITSALIYMLFMLAWLKITIELSQVKIIQIIIACIALIGALVNLKSYYKSRKNDVGCTVTDSNKRKNIIDKIKKFTSEKSLILAVLGAITLAISVNFVELACSAGLPVVFTQILALNDLSSIEYFSYVLLYILFYLADDLIVFVIAMVTMKLTGITNKYNKYSHLIGGIIMLIIGLLMLLKPEWLMMNF